MADTISAEDYARWLTPGSVLDRITTGALSSKMESIAHRLQDGFIDACARRVRLNGEPLEFVLITAGAWAAWPFLDDHSFWTMGDVTLWKRDSAGYAREPGLRLYGIRLNPDQVEAEFPGATTRPAPNSVADASPAPKSNTGGAPGKAFWEDMIIDIAARIHLGDLKPESKNHLAKVMLDWAAERGHDVGETAVKARARKIWDAGFGGQ